MTTTIQIEQQSELNIDDAIHAIAKRILPDFSVAHIDYEKQIFDTGGRVFKYKTTEIDGKYYVQVIEGTWD